MKSKSDEVVRLEGWMAFLIPFLSGIAAIGAIVGDPLGRVIAIVCSAIVAGLSGLKSFLSTTFSDSNDARLAAVTPPTDAEKLANADAALNHPTPK
jgi:hypothetical protein